MTGAGAASALVDRGLDPAEHAAKQSLFDIVLRHFGEVTGAAPRHCWWVPGRLEVFGKHTDYAGGRTLVCAVPRGFAIAASPRADRRIQVLDALRGQRMVIPANGDQSAAATDPASSLQRVAGWCHYVEAVCARLHRNFPGARFGADLVIASDLPSASGMSSSSALVVGVAAALVRTAAIERRTEWLANIRGDLDRSAYFACMENGSGFGTLQGDAGVGTHGGSEDHAAIVTGRPGRLAAFAFVPMRHISDVKVPDEWRFVLTRSGVAADKTGGALGPYNRLARGAGLLLDIWNGFGPPAASLAEALRTSSSAVDRLLEGIRRSTVEGWPSGALERRLAHFIREDARVPAAAEAFRDADSAALDSLARGSQLDAEALLENQVPETVMLVQSARALGAFAASSFGAGFGGSVWALVDQSAAPELARRWHPDAFIAVPGPGLTEL